MTRCPRHFHRQHGVAIITALLLTALSVILVTSLFWQQQVQARALENQRLQMQTHMLMRSALDWIRVILRDDTSNSTTDHLDEPWAAPLSATRLDEYLRESGNERDLNDAALSGNISDAQARYNLRNLALHGTVNEEAVAVLKRLLAYLRIDPGLADNIAIAMGAQPWQPIDLTGTAQGNKPRQTDPAASRIDHIDDLLAIPGITPGILAQLREHVVVLPAPTEINVNTASALVLSARLPALSMEEARALIDSRRHIHLRDGADLSIRSFGKISVDQANAMAFATNYFLVDSKVRVRKAAWQMQALIERNIMVGPRTVWMRED